MRRGKSHNRVRAAVEGRTSAPCVKICKLKVSWQKLESSNDGWWIKMKGKLVTYAFQQGGFLSEIFS